VLGRKIDEVQARLDGLAGAMMAAAPAAVTTEVPMASGNATNSTTGTLAQEAAPAHGEATEAATQASALHAMVQRAEHRKIHGKILLKASVAIPEKRSISFLARSVATLERSEGSALLQSEMCSLGRVSLEPDDMAEL